MSEENKNKRKDRMKNRFNNSTDKTGENGETNTTEETSKTNKTNENDGNNKTKTGTKVTDLKGRTFYVGEETLDNLDILYEETALEYRKQHGEKLEKSKEFYPAMFRAVVEGTTVQEELGLDE